jgi:O-antigen/teichoic acid export membrane protein
LPQPHIAGSFARRKNSHYLVYRFSMGIIARQGTASSAIYIVGIALGYLNMAVLFPLLMPEEQFGLVRVLIAFALILVHIANLGMPMTIVRYFPVLQEKANRHGGILFFGLMVALAGFLVASVGLYFIRDIVIDAYRTNSPELQGHFRYLYPLVLFLVVFEVFEFYARALLRTVFPNLVREILLRIFTLAALLIWHFAGLSFVQFLAMFLAGYALQSVVMMAYLNKQGELFLKPDLRIFRDIRLKEMMVYGMFTMLSSGSILLVINIDTIMLGYLAGLDDIAVYTVAFFLGNVIQIPYRALGQIAMPLISQAWSKNDKAAIDKLYKQTSVMQLLIGGWLFVMIWASSGTILGFLPDSYQAGLYVVFFIGLGRLFDLFSGVNHEIIVTSRYFRFNFYAMSALAVLTVATNYWLIPLYGITGAAVATAISISLFNLAKLIFIYRWMGMQPITQPLVLVTGFIILALAGATLVPVLLPPLADVAVKCVVVTTAFAAFAWMFRISPEGFQIAQTLYGRVFGRNGN